MKRAPDPETWASSLDDLGTAADYTLDDHNSDYSVDHRQISSQ